MKRLSLSQLFAVGEPARPVLSAVSSSPVSHGSEAVRASFVVSSSHAHNTPSDATSVTDTNGTEINILCSGR